MFEANSPGREGVCLRLPGTLLEEFAGQKTSGCSCIAGFIFTFLSPSSQV